MNISKDERDIIDEIIKFKDLRGKIFVSSAPGRVNLIGEHTDYNMGFVMPCAINLKTVAIGRFTNHEREISIESLNLGEKTKVSFDNINPTRTWADYILGPIFLLKNKIGNLDSGLDIIIRGNVPIGGGLSSSASCEVAISSLLNEMFNLKMGKIEIVRISKRAENEFVGVPCGIMDQMSSVFGKENHAMVIDCKTEEIEYIKFPENWSIVICDSGVKHKLGESEYKKRQSECQQALKIIKERTKENDQIESLRDIDEYMLDILKRENEILWKRAKFVVEENKRVLTAKEAIKKGDKETISKVFIQSHIGLQKEYEVSCEELDTLVEIAYDFKYTVGARMTGAGFGGNTINIVEKGREEEFAEFVQEKYKSKTNKKTEIRIVKISDGAKSFQLEI
jgi:galactokinase